MLTLESLKGLVWVYKGNELKNDKLMKFLIKQGMMEEGILTDKGKKIAGAAVTILARLSKGVPILERSEKHPNRVCYMPVVARGDISVIKSSLVWFGTLPFGASPSDLTDNQYTAVTLFRTAINNRAGWQQLIPVEYRIYEKTLLQMVGLKDSKGKVTYINANYFDFLSEYVSDPRWFLTYGIPLEKEGTVSDIVLCARLGPKGRTIQAAIIPLGGIE